MEVQVVDSGPCRRSLTIKIPTEEIKEKVDEAFKSAAAEVQIKGFRAGHVPRAILEKRHGEEILGQAKENLISASFEEAVRDNDIAFIGKPKLEGVGEEPLSEDAPLEFQIHLSVKPEVKLAQVKGIEVTAGNTDVTDEDIDAGLDQLAARKRTLQPVDEPVEEGDFVKADLVFKHDGEVVHERKNSQITANIPVVGTDQEVFKNNLIGTEKGKVLEIEIKFPDTFEKAAVRGKEGQVDIHVHEVMRVTPPVIDDAFALGFEFDSLDALKEDLRKRIGEQKVTENTNRIEAEIINAILAENPFPVPAFMVEDQTRVMLQEASEHMRENGMDDEAIKAEVERHKDEAAREAEYKVRIFFMFEAICRSEKIFITESDIDAEVRTIAAANDITPPQARQALEENDRIPDVRLALQERKVRDFLREHARITDK